MEEGRLLKFKLRKPSLVLTNAENKFLRDFNVGDKGQLSCVLEVESISLEMDENGNEMKNFSLSVKNIELIENQNIRLV